MLRLLLFLAFVAAPFPALAHEGHHADGKAQSAPAERAQPSANRTAMAAMAAPSRCPGGGHEACCCHEFTGTPSYQPVAIAHAGPCELTPALPDAEIARDTQSAPRSIELARYSPRGPPLYS